MDLLALACALVAIALYYNTLNAGFVYDDRRAILTNNDLKPTTPWSRLLENDFWGTPLREAGSHGSYRPLCVATYRLNYAWAGHEPYGYHLVNVLLHAACTALVVRIARKVLPGQRLAQTVSGLLFAVHPIHTEAVAGIVGRADLLACLLTQGAFLTYVAHCERRRPLANLALTLLLAVLATLAKETGISSLALCLLWDFCHSERLLRKIRKRWPSSTIVAGGLAIITLGRLRAGGGRTPEFATADNPVARHPSRLARGLTFLYLPAASLGMLLCPCTLSFDWSMNAVPVVASLADLRNLESLLLYGTLGAATIWACRSLRRHSLYRSRELRLQQQQQQHRTMGHRQRINRSYLVDQISSSYTSQQQQHQTHSMTTGPTTANIALATAAAAASSSYCASTTTVSSPTTNHFHPMQQQQQQQNYSFSACPSSTNNCLGTVSSTTLSSGSSSPLTTSSSSRCPVCAGRRIGSCHTDGCRAINNNNNGPVAECHCPKKKQLQHQQLQMSKVPQMQHYHHHLQPQLQSQPHQTTASKRHNNNNNYSNYNNNNNNNNNNYNNNNNNNNNNMNYNYNHRGLLNPRSILVPSSLLTIIGFLVFPFLPASNLFFYVGFVIAERILYLPSVGACLAIGAAIGATYNQARRRGLVRLARLVLAMTALLLGCMFAKTLARNVDWQNEENLYRSALRINPPKAYGNLGSVLSAEGRIDEAEEAFTEALRHRPNMADVHYNLGIIQQSRQNYHEAILSFQRAIHFRPTLAQAYVNLGSTLTTLGRENEAVVVLRAAASIDGSALKDRKAHEVARLQALLQLGSIYAEQGRLHSALSTYREALKTMPEHYPRQSVYNLLGETLSRLQQYSEAEKWFRASLASQPNHVPAHITYGKLLARNSSRITEAERWFLRARRLAPQDSSVHHHYGLFLSMQGRLSEAAEAHLEAATLSRQDYDLAMAAASSLRRAARCEEAELWYRHALSLRPLEARSHANLGAILHLNGKYRQAAAAYREALRLQPGDPTTITNLHKLASLLV
ncbi:hypothetical protein TKK_0011724 [Trichogramma kaykai]|uniref:dolichyl-phosphate-mannose--protein mannosyltransferase n=1 Tax=Trichogramma kaykai TaxID=54128 RepID=A0ABD2WPV9_9HYME